MGRFDTKCVTRLDLFLEQIDFQVRMPPFGKTFCVEVDIAVVAAREKVDGVYVRVCKRIRKTVRVELRTDSRNLLRGVKV